MTNCNRMCFLFGPYNVTDLAILIDTALDAPRTPETDRLNTCERSPMRTGSNKVRVLTRGELIERRRRSRSRRDQTSTHSRCKGKCCQNFSFRLSLSQTDGTAATRATRRSAAPAPRTSPTRAPSSTGSRTRGRSGAGKREKGLQIEI